jgi:hypothetical protein
MAAISALWGMFFGTSETAEERRVKLIDSIRLHGTATRAKYQFGQSSVTDEFFVLVARSEPWLATNGDYPSSETHLRTRLYSSNEIAEYVNQEIINDEVVIQHVRNEIDEDGFASADFFDSFSDEEYKLVFIHPSHFISRIELNNKDNFYYLHGPLNKTRDPFAAFDPTCAIAKELVDVAGEKMHEYTIVVPQRAVVREVYNKESRRVGKKEIA